MDQVQELYLHLEHRQNGDRNMAYYGQLRAKEKTHAEALEETILYFNLRARPWYQNRIGARGKGPSKLGDLL